MNRSNRARRWIRGLLAALVSGRALLVGDVLFAGIDPESNTDGFNPAAELYDIAEAQRQVQVAKQLSLNGWMIDSICYEPGDLWGPPIGGPPIRQPIGYESKQIGPDRWIYRPLYPDDSAGAAELPSPAFEPRAAGENQPQLPAPSDAAPADHVRSRDKPAPSTPGGPREF